METVTAQDVVSYWERGPWQNLWRENFSVLSNDKANKGISVFKISL